MVDAVGWLATAILTISYAAKDPTKLRWIQSVAALLWITSGVLIHSRPVIAANVVVAGAAVYSSLRLLKKKRKPRSAALLTKTDLSVITGYTLCCPRIAKIPKTTVKEPG